MNDETAERLTLKGYFPDDPERYWLDDEAAIAKYGIIEGTAEFDDITLQNNLFDRGTEFQKNNNRIRHSYQAEVLDLSTIGKAADAFRAGNYYLFKKERSIFTSHTSQKSKLATRWSASLIPHPLRLRISSGKRPRNNLLHSRCTITYMIFEIGRIQGNNFPERRKINEQIL